MQNQNKYPKIETALAELNIVYDAEFVPLSRSRNAKEKSPTLNWKIKLGRARKTPSLETVWILETDYQQGIAHYPDYKQSGIGKSSYDRRIYEQMLAKGAEDGIWYVWIKADNWQLYRAKMITQGQSQAIGWPIDKDIGFNTTVRARIPKPTFVEVMACLIMDCDVLNCSTFEQWAEDLGFDKDSRNAERIYKSCVESALKMNSLIGGAKIEELRELYNEEGY